MLEKLTFRDGTVPRPSYSRIDLERACVDAEFDIYGEFDYCGNHVSFGELQDWFYTHSDFGYGDGAVTIIDVNSNLIGNASAEFKETLDKINLKNRQIIVNLSAVQRIDSIAIGVLVSRTVPLRKKGGDLKIYGLNAHLKQIFERVGASRLPKFIYLSEESALADF